MMRLSEIQIRDPFILPVKSQQLYYLFGTTDKDCWNGPFVGFDCYFSPDLENWSGPIPAFRPPADFWANANFWAPEVFAFNGKFWMLATFANSTKPHLRGTQILVSGAPSGPFVLWSDGPLTPPERLCLDGTIFFDESQNPWLVFCHEWVQIGDGAICAQRLSPDLKVACGTPQTLWRASEAPWVLQNETKQIEGKTTPVCVTDGPFVHRTQSGALLILWSSYSMGGYTMGVARSKSGTILGPWTQDENPLWANDGGHGMIFRGFDGRLRLTFHAPNQTPHERATFFELREVGENMKLMAA